MVWIVIGLIVLLLLVLSGWLSPKHVRIARNWERTLITMEQAANAGAWDAASRCAHSLSRMELAAYTCKGAPDGYFEKFLRSRGLVRSIRDPEYQRWISDELFKRGLLPRS